MKVYRPFVPLWLICAGLGFSRMNHGRSDGSWSHMASVITEILNPLGQPHGDPLERRYDQALRSIKGLSCRLRLLHQRPLPDGAG